MAQSTLKKVLEEVMSLKQEELREVERAVRARLETTSKEEERERALRVIEESGLVRQVKRPPMTPSMQRPPVPITGQPISETIIEERR